MEEESQALLEIERKKLQEDQDILWTQQLNGQFNNTHVSSGNNSPPSTTLKTPWVEDTREHLHDLLALEEEGLQDIIIIVDQHLLGF